MTPKTSERHTAAPVAWRCTCLRGGERDEWHSRECLAKTPPAQCRALGGSAILSPKPATRCKRMTSDPSGLCVTHQLMQAEGRLRGIAK